VDRLPGQRDLHLLQRAVANLAATSRRRDRFVSSIP